MGDTFTSLERLEIPDVVGLTIARIPRGLEDAQFTCRELCDVCLSRTAEVNGTLNAVIQTNPEVVAIATSRDRDCAENYPRGALHGVPILVKNVFHAGDSIVTTAGSIALAGISNGTSTVVEKLVDEGAVILGTTNLSEYANLRSELCPGGWSPLGGQCYGIYAKLQNLSGSSSGSSVAARLGLAAGTLGTENNGSITSPAAQSATVGFKTTVGLISRHGVIAFNKYQDCPGPITRFVEDAAALLSILAGPDDYDSLTEEIPKDMDFNFRDACPSSLKGLRLAVPRATVVDSIDDPEVLACFGATLDQLRQQGAIILDDVEYPSWARSFSRDTSPFRWANICPTFPPTPTTFDHWKMFGNMQTLAREKTPSLGGTRFIKALNTLPTDAEADFQTRHSKGAEIVIILEQNSCDAIIVPEGCRSLSDLGQSPVICLPMGFYSASSETKYDEYQIEWIG